MGHAGRAAAIDAVLPQTQCAQCGYPGCLPYAEALAAGEAPIDRCVPGGRPTLEALSALTGQPAPAPDPAQPPVPALERALIDETHCIGCTLCLEACPVDAIMGGPKLMHTVIAAECTGCELCLAPCPMDCIRMVEPSPALRAWTPARADRARHRHETRRARRAKQGGPAGEQGADPSVAAGAEEAPAATGPQGPLEQDPALRRQLILDAVARVRARRTTAQQERS